MIRFYQAVNANRVIAGKTFEITDLVASTAWGVYKTDSEPLIAQLDALVKEPRNGVTEITELEYNNALESKKNLATWPTLPASRPKPETGPPLKEIAGVVIEERPEEVEDPNQPIEIKQGVTSVEEALSTVNLTPEQPEPAQESPPPTPKVKKAKAKV